MRQIYGMESLINAVPLQLTWCLLTLAQIDVLTEVMHSECSNITRHYVIFKYQLCVHYGV